MKLLETHWSLSGKYLGSSYPRPSPCVDCEVHREGTTHDSAASSLSDDSL